MSHSSFNPNTTTHRRIVLTVAMVCCLSFGFVIGVASEKYGDQVHEYFTASLQVLK